LRGWDKTVGTRAGARRRRRDGRGLGGVRACVSADAWARADGRPDVCARAPATARRGEARPPVRSGYRTHCEIG
jgi:hypothetical protein